MIGLLIYVVPFRWMPYVSARHYTDYRSIYSFRWLGLHFGFCIETLIGDSDVEDM